MARDRAGPAADRMLAVRLDAIATRHARWGAITEDQSAAAVDELREIADGRSDLLAEVAGLALGTTERKGPEYQARGQAVARLCRMAGADESLIAPWIQEGRRRAETRRMPPFSQPGQRMPRRP
ncbi:MAG TPA: hypothetical protein VJ418_22120 [Streptosporangiaceae bacterium]|nr:hypothetical protein [Streptosporangiaceae bacterium]